MANTPSSSGTTSGTLTVRGLPPGVKSRLRVRAARNQRSMEAEARAILEAALAATDDDTTDLATFAQVLFAPLGGVELELPARAPVREPPSLGPRKKRGSARGRDASVAKPLRKATGSRKR
jgi:plasmid stability protein